MSASCILRSRRGFREHRIRATRPRVPSTKRLLSAGARIPRDSASISADIAYNQQLAATAYVAKSTLPMEAPWVLSPSASRCPLSPQGQYSRILSPGYARGSSSAFAWSRDAISPTSPKLKRRALVQYPTHDQTRAVEAERRAAFVARPADCALAGGITGRCPPHPSFRRRLAEFRTMGTAEARRGWESAAPEDNK